VLAVYLLTLAVSAGVVGVFFRTLLADAGYIPEFQAGVAFALGAASAYIAVELLFMTVIRFIWPTRSHLPLVGDCVSHGAVVVLLPSLLGVAIDWPHPILERVAPLLFFGAFVAFHVLLKLLSLYAILQAEPGTRLGNVFWAAAVALFCLTAYIPFTMWLESMRSFQPRAPEVVEAYEYGGAYAVAHVVPEGAIVETEFSAPAATGLTLRWAPVAEDAEDEPVEGIFATATMHGDSTRIHTAWIPFDEAGWAVMHIPPDEVPAGLTKCDVFWYEQQEPKWRSTLGIRPIVQDGRTVMLSGPFAHSGATAGESRPNVVVVVVDGLGTDRVSSLGDVKDTTPFLDRFRESAVVFPNTYTPAPEPSAAFMTILTGVSPLRHGYLGAHDGPRPETCPSFVEALQAAGYATAAFTEGAVRTDFAFGSGFERGFEHYDTSYDPVDAAVDPMGDAAVSAGSAATLERALQWMAFNQHARCATVIYLGELRDMTYRERYGVVRAQGQRPPTTDEVYLAGLRYLDERIGEFVRGIRGLEHGEAVCIAITATHGADFTPPPKLTESVLRVPMWISAPGIERMVRRDPRNLAALEDLAPTLTALAGVPFGDAKSLLENPLAIEPVSMAGDPVVLTVRNDRWRLYWPSQRSPFTGSHTGEAQRASLFDLSRMRAGQTLSDVASQNPQIVQRWTAMLDAYLSDESQTWTVSSPN
jgi:arylsulfatase A-like enzyme